MYSTIVSLQEVLSFAKLVHTLRVYNPGPLKVKTLLKVKSNVPPGFTDPVTISFETGPLFSW